MNWQRPLMLALGITGGMVAIGGFATLFTVYVQGSISDPVDILRIASAELAAGRYRIAEGLAERVEVDPEESPEIYASREYLLGATRTQQALQNTEKRQRRLALRNALPTLEEAAANGALDDLRGRFGNLVWGQAAYELGQYDTANERLTRAISLDPTAARELLPLLIRSRIQAPQIPASKAVEACESLLRIPNLSDDERVAAHLMMAEARMKAAEWTQAARSLEEAKRLQPNNDAVTLMDADLKLAQSEEIKQRLNGNTIPPVVARLLEDVLDAVSEVARTGDPGAVTRANYLGARALRLMGRDDSAIEVFSNVRLSRDPAYMPAAGIQELELLAKNKHEAELLTSAKLVIQDIGDPQVYDGTLLRIEACRERLAAIADRLIEGGLYRTAIDYARLLSPLVPANEALNLEGRAWSTWANKIEQESLRTNSILAPSVATTVRQYNREAGRAWNAAAQLQFMEKSYPDQLWLAIEALQRGGAHEKSMELLSEYLRYEPRDGQPRGLVAQGRSLLALGKVTEALRPLVDCIEQYPNDPQRYEARLVAAKCHGELGQYAPARTLLEANLYDNTLIPESPLWRDSLLALGNLLYRQGLETHVTLTRITPSPTVPPVEQRTAVYQLLNDAIDRLETADERYSDSYRSALGSRYLAGLAHRMAAHWPLEAANQPDTIDSVRRELLSERQTHLETALQEMGSLRKKLNEMQEKNAQLTENEELMLRSTYLSEGDTLFDLNRFDRALEVYASAAQLYSGEPLSLEATVRQARCYTALNRPEEAARAYRQAAKNLERIPENQDNMFLRTTRLDREGWKNMLSWMNRT